MHKSQVNSLDELWERTKAVYYTYDTATLERIWRAKQEMIKAIHKNNGQTTLVPHKGVRKEQQGLYNGL